MALLWSRNARSFDGGGIALENGDIITIDAKKHYQSKNLTMSLQEKHGYNPNQVLKGVLLKYIDQYLRIYRMCYWTKERA
jgi:hypothetical protein